MYLMLKRKVLGFVNRNYCKENTEDISGKLISSTSIHKCICIYKHIQTQIQENIYKNTTIYIYIYIYKHTHYIYIYIYRHTFFLAQLAITVEYTDCIAAEG